MDTKLIEALLNGDWDMENAAQEEVKEEVNIDGGREIPEAVEYGTQVAPAMFDSTEDQIEMTKQANKILAEKLEAMRKESVMENKQLRVDMDKCLQILKGHDKPTRASQERSIAMRKLQEAIMWLGMDNKALHEQNPYPNSMDPTNAKVEPTADGLKM